MKRSRSLLVVLVLLGWIAAGCTRLPVELAPTLAPIASPLPGASATPSLTFTPAASLAPTLTKTPSPSPVPCDPAADFCIVTSHFLLARPIAPLWMDEFDPSYLYGTTQNGAREPHHGLEFENASGTPVLAAADGVVAVAGKDDQVVYGPTANFYGNLVVLEHHFPGIIQTVYTLYGHLSRIDVQVGQLVRTGDRIGAVGSSGEAIGSHLHFEVRLGNNDYDSNRNPLLWLKPLKAQDGSRLGVLAGRLQDAQGNPIHTRGLNIQYYPDPAGSVEGTYPTETYAPEKHPVRGDDVWMENFALGDLPAGAYRLSIVWAGKVIERTVQVQPAALTLVTITLK